MKTAARRMGSLILLLAVIGYLALSFVLAYVNDDVCVPAHDGGGADLDSCEGR